MCNCCACCPDAFLIFTLQTKNLLNSATTFNRLRSSRVNIIKMVFILIIIIVCSVIYGQSYPFTDPSNSIGWTQDWTLTDEFWNQNTLNSDKWWDINRGWLGRQPGLFSPDIVQVANGKLYLNTNLERES